jgi:hypothetical protein
MRRFYNFSNLNPSTSRNPDNTYFYQHCIKDIFTFFIITFALL